MNLINIVQSGREDHILISITTLKIKMDSLTVSRASATGWFYFKLCVLYSVLSLKPASLFILIRQM